MATRTPPPGVTIGTFWLNRLEEGDLVRQDWLRVQEAAVDRFEGVHTIMRRSPGSDQVGFNKFYSAETNIMANLRPVDWSVRPIANKPSEQDGADLLGKVIDHTFLNGEFLTALTDAIQNGRIRGCGIVKVAWSGPLGADSETIRAVEAEDEKAAKQIAALRRAFPIPQIGDPIAMAWNVDPEDYIQDPEATSVRFATWAAHRTYYSRDTLKELFDSGFFEGSLEDIREFRHALPSDQRRMSSNLRFRRRFAPGRRSHRHASKIGTHRGDDQVAVWEIWDKEENEVVYIVPGMPKPLRRFDIDIAAEGMPFFDIRFTSRPWRFWVFPDMWHYLSAQDLLDKLVSIYASHVNRFGKVVVAVPKGTPSADKDSIGAAVGGEVVEFEGQPPVPLNFGTIPADVPALIGLAGDIIHQVSGVSALAAGIEPSGAQTATGIAALDAGFSARLKQMRVIVRDTMSRIARYTAQLLQQFFPGAAAVRVLGADAPEWEENITLEQIQGEFDFTIEVGEEAEIRTELRRKQMIELWNMVSEAPEINRMELLRKLLREFGLKPDVYLNQQAPPDQQAAMEALQGAGAEGLAGAGGGTQGSFGRGGERAAGAPQAPGAPAENADLASRGGAVDIQQILGGAQRANTGRAAA